MAEHVPDRTAMSLSKHLKHALKVYGHAGYRVRTIINGKFRKIKQLMLTIECKLLW